MSTRILTTLVLVAAAAAGGARAAPGPSPAGRPSASAEAASVRILLPGVRPVTAPVVNGLPGAGTDSWSAPAFSYPVDGSVIVTGKNRAAASAGAGTVARAGSSSSAGNISIFDGEITADSVTAGATARTGASSPTGGFGGTGVVHLQALGRARAAGTMPLGDWGTLTIGRHTVDRSAPAGVKGYSAVVVGVDIRLTAAHGGLPAGSEIQIAYATADVATAPPPARPAPATHTGPIPGDRPQLLPPATGPLIGVPQVVAPELTGGPYVFPVFGASSYADDYGDSRTGLAYQHGVDIAGQLGQPIVAVADGTLFSVGWNHAAGNRLSLRDRQGNQFSYSHLSAFSTLAQNGAHVRAGQVIGFMGNTGYAQGLPTHLHFEVRPVSMLFLGTDGAVDPAAYLGSWRHLATLAFPVATGWAPKVPGTIEPPHPGAILLGGSDISSADGLAPATLRRAVGS